MNSPSVKHPRLCPPDAIVLACTEELDGELLSYDERLAQAPRTRGSKRDR
jgi:predicted nucleic acid-binding protein